MSQTVIELYDRFTHGDLSRRDCLDRLARAVDRSSAALALIPSLRNDYSKRLVSAQDDRLDISQAQSDAGRHTHVRIPGQIEERRKTTGPLRELDATDTLARLAVAVHS